MSAPKGNKNAEGNEGKEKTFKTPYELSKAFEDYKTDTDANPWIRFEVIKGGQDAGKLLPVPMQRPYTLGGFATFLKMTYQGVKNYGEMEGYEEYFEVYEKIENECTSQKFEGAVVGVFNANIIARDLGLTDNISSKHNIQVQDLPDIVINLKHGS